VLSLTEAPAYPHNRARQTFVEMNGSMQPAPAPRLSRTPSRPSANVPDIGEHSVAILADLGIPRPEIDRLIAEGAVYASDATVPALP
jgi:alpha-methylacyl-CoA racemase